MQMLQSIAMGRFSTLALTVLLLIVISAPAIDGQPTGKFNTSSGCNCHSTTAIDAQLSGYPSTYTAGEQYILNIGMSVSAPAGGFSLDIDKGTLSNPSTDAQVNPPQRSATHSSSDSTSWTVTWTAPSSGSGMVTFSLAVLAADGNNSIRGRFIGDTFCSDSRSKSKYRSSGFTLSTIECRFIHRFSGYYFFFRCR